MIKIIYSSIDGFRKARSFKSLKGAQAFAHRYVGPHPDRGSSYAVSDDGIGKIVIGYGSGISLADLFPSA